MSIRLRILKLDLYNLPLPRQIRRLRPIFRVQLAQYIRYMILHRTLGQHQFICNFAVAGSGGQQLQNLDFAGAQFFSNQACR
jgi:hypothetical protein